MTASLGGPRDVTFVVDPSMYGGAYLPPRDVYGDLDTVVRPDMRYHYSTPICAQRWAWSWLRRTAGSAFG